MLPVFEPGALFFLGDGHARQGDGEVVGSAVETSLDVEFSVDLIKGKKNECGPPPRKFRTTSWCSGSSRALNEALQHATTELMRWLMDSYGFDERGASLLLGPRDGVRDLERGGSGVHNRFLYLFFRSAHCVAQLRQGDLEIPNLPTRDGFG